jgi:hypothetical protein
LVVVGGGDTSAGERVAGRADGWGRSYRSSTSTTAWTTFISILGLGPNREVSLDGTRTIVQTESTASSASLTAARRGTCGFRASTVGNSAAGRRARRGAGGLRASTVGDSAARRGAWARGSALPRGSLDASTTRERTVFYSLSLAENKATVESASALGAGAAMRLLALAGIGRRAWRGTGWLRASTVGSSAARRRAGRGAGGLRASTVGNTAARRRATTSNAT